MMRTDAYEDEPHTQRDPEQLPEVKKKKKMEICLVSFECILLPHSCGNWHDLHSVYVTFLYIGSNLEHIAIAIIPIMDCIRHGYQS